MTDNNKLEATNHVLRDLERKLSLVLTVSLATSHGSVVRDPQYGGMAKESIQLSVIKYIRNSGSDFDPDLVYSERRQRLTTCFDREYSPDKRSSEDLPKSFGVTLNSSALNGCHEKVDGSYPLESFERDTGDYGFGSENEQELRFSADSVDPYDAYYDDSFDRYSESDSENDPSDPEDVIFENDLLPPLLPRRLPPKEMDPNRLYGLFDFLGPDPLHCTLFRDEPVYLVNDLDNYWWLIRKLTKEERRECSKEDVVSDDEDGKIGFVPAECLETHGERLARLNCFKNEVLEKSTGALPSSAYSEPGLSLLQGHGLGKQTLTPDEPALSPIRRKGSILKKSRSYKRNDKQVTFENLAEFALGDENGDYHDEDGAYDPGFLSYKYYGLSHEDIITRTDDDSERHSEVLSDVYPANKPLHLPKTIRDVHATEHILNMDFFTEPKLTTGDDISIGTYSPDTPPAQRSGSARLLDEQSDVRRSVILDKLSEVTSLLKNSQEYKELSFGGSLRVKGSKTLSEKNSHTRRYESNRLINETSRMDNGTAETAEKADTIETAVLDSLMEDDASLLDYGESRQLIAEELTPLTSSNSLSLPGVSPKLPQEKKKWSKYEKCLPVIGQLEELTRKLAELEHLFE